MKLSKQIDRWLEHAASVYGDDGTEQLDVRKVEASLIDLRRLSDWVPGCGRKLSETETCLAQLKAPGADRMAHLRNSFSDLRKIVRSERDYLRDEGR